MQQASQDEPQRRTGNPPEDAFTNAHFVFTTGQPLATNLLPRSRAVMARSPEAPRGRRESLRTRSLSLNVRLPPSRSHITSRGGRAVHHPAYCFSSLLAASRALGPEVPVHQCQRMRSFAAQWSGT